MLIEHPEERAAYVALSHCWGTPVTTCQATTTTLDDLKNIGIEWSSLPKTFQDAVIVSKAIGINYLWIDSLCILQDSRSDWEIESARMRDVYEGAVLVIGAEASSSDRGGFLHKRPSHFIEKATCTFAGTPFNVHISNPVPHRQFELRNQPLARRGWTYQENFLARRYLSFTTHEMRWRCVKGQCCECGSLKNVPGGLYGDDHTSYTIQGLLPSDLCTIWTHDVVAKYSNRALTKPKDRLPAISAVAKVFQNHLYDVYLTGLWKGNIAKDLLWSLDPDSHPAQSVTSGYRAPSWSWASIDTPVNFWSATGDFQPCVHIVDARCTPLGADPTGEVAAGYLTVIGQIMEATVCLWSDYKDDTYSAHRVDIVDTKGPVGAEMTADAPLKILNISAPDRELITTVKRAISRETIPVGQAVKNDQRCRVWILLTGEGSGNWYGLVLAESENHSGCYERVGITKGDGGFDEDEPITTEHVERTITIV